MLVVISYSSFMTATITIILLPLSSVITEANKHDMKSAFPTMDSIVVDRPKVKQNICMDKGYDFSEIEYGVRRRG